MRARKSLLRNPWDLQVLRGAADLPRFAEALGAPAVRGEAELEHVLFGRLLDDYRRVLDDYAPGRPLLRALLARHEVENLKLGWRALDRRLPADRWARLWRPFGRLETLPLESWTEASSLPDAVRATAPTPWGPIAREALETHGDDGAAAELSLDRFAFARIAEEAERLPRRETAARRLAMSIVSERDLDAFHRAIVFSGLSPELAASTTVRLRDAFPTDALHRLAEWSSGPLPLDRRLFRGVLPPDRPIADWDALRRTLARERVAACRRAFAGPPFRVGPAVAFLLLREAETRGLAAIASLLPSPGAGEREGVSTGDADKESRPRPQVALLAKRAAGGAGGEGADYVRGSSSALEHTLAASLLGG
jgi:hypothetical protein